SAKGHTMPYIKLLIALAGLSFLVACGGSATPANNNAGGDNNGGDNSGGDNSGGDNSGGGGNGGGGGGNATDCTTSPFHADCLTNNAPALRLRQTMCLADSTTNPSCVGETGVIITFCKTNPFSTETPCMTDDYRILRQTRCLTASNAHTSCPTILAGLVNHDDYLTIGDAPPLATVTEAIADTDILSHFLSVGAISARVNNSIDTTGLRITINDPTEATPKILSRAGDALDGVTYVRGNIEGQIQSFVGLLPSTNLGAPLPNTTPNATWRGSYFSAAGDDIFDIDFMINFSTSKINATDTQGVFVTTFDLDFTAEGVITGDVILGSSIPDDTAQARGLIGEQGLVGGFANTDGGSQVGVLYGTFVADNPAFDDEPAVVSYLDWVDVTTPDTTRADPLTNQFLTGADSITNDVAEFGSLNLNNAEPTDGTAFGGDVNDGFELSGNDPSEATHYYVGILTTTNLGAPLTEQTAEGTWEGRLYATRATGAVRSTEVADFTPTVTFNTKTISATIPGVINLGGAAIVPGTVSYDFTAIWDERGVFESTINRTLSDVASAGKLTGLIGQGGAVGVFISNAGAAVGYAGGFVARKAP
ncbi:MAG: hypothetical protein K8953_06700, partial [Proteobacteria bacterium]|nr:hypothetical protein [Pseudomonadota bacterium]